MNTDELEEVAYAAERRVLKIQAKLHRWAAEDPLAGLMTCTISSATRPSCLQGGCGCGATRVRARPEWTA